MTIESDIRTANWRRATEGARKALDRPHSRPRVGRLTRQAVDALVNLRADIAAGLPAGALLDRIDDELFKIQRGISGGR